MFNSNASSADAGGADYIEDVFSTWLYTGNGSTQTITNGIDLAGEGGLVWLKSRSQAEEHGLIDTVRGRASVLRIGSSSTAAAATSGSTNDLTAFNSDGFSLGTSQRIACNDSGENYASWTFREQPKFFDIVTYTGDGDTVRKISHNLGSLPAFVLIKRTDSTSNWATMASLADESVVFIILNSTAAAYSAGGNPNSSTQLAVGRDWGWGATNDPNINGATYVAYLFAHDAGGFGLTGTDNVISCGSFTTDGSGNATVSLGYEPQWVMVKRTDSDGDWLMLDVMRSWSQTNDAYLYANYSDAEANVSGNYVYPSSTGFVSANGAFSSSATFIYIAIRRGPMKVPTDGTKVFVPVARTGTSSATTVTAGFPVSLSVIKQRDNIETWNWSDRLRGNSAGYLVSSGNFAEQSNTARVTGFASNIGISVGNDSQVNASGSTYSNLFLQRAPNFMDEVCWTGDGTASRNQVHNLGVKPELTIVKKRSGTGSWGAVCILPGSTSQVILNSAAASPALISGVCFGISASLFVVGDEGSGVADVNATGQTYVAYFFASCPGVSKVGTYTGTGTTQQINCGFTAGSRFVMIKRTDDTGDWYVWDSARGIVPGNDPYQLFNSNAAEVTSTDYVDTYSAGFELTATAPAAINASGGSYIFLAIA